MLSGAYGTEIYIVKTDGSKRHRQNRKDPSATSSEE